MNKTFLRGVRLALAPAVLLACGLGTAGLAGAAQPPAGATATPKVLRLALASRENNFDPAQISDVISAALVSSLFDAPLTYDHLARPARLKPNTAAGLPEVNADFTHFVFRIKPGIFFPDHAAFGGKPRELVAADYVYSIKRYYDPATRSPTLFHYEGAGLLGLNELRKQSLDQKKPFDYDTEVPGLRTLDRYSFELRVARPAPRLPYVLASPALAGALAREVVEVNPGTIGERPHGTGPFKLGAWTRGTRIVLERNPAHSHNVYDAEPNADDAAGQALARQLRGRQMPMLDRVDISIIEEAQPRWLSFLNQQIDMVAVPNEFVNMAAPRAQVAPNLAKRGVRLHQEVAVSTWYTYFGMENPVVGGYEPHKVALRRALAMAYDVQREIDLVRRGQAVAPQTILPPGIPGYDAALKSEMSDFSLPRAKALLELYGYVDRDGDGWREQPDGTPLVLEYTSETSQAARQLQGIWQKSMNALGVQINFTVRAWQENIKASRAGKLMMWGTGWTAALPDASYFLDVMYGPNKGMSNHSRFDLPAVNELHLRQRVLPDGPERAALVQQALKLSLAYMPMKATAHPINSWLTHPQVKGYVPHPFIRDYWRFMDMDSSEMLH
ncbi:MAG: ABC transporter substrate-binding protein [Rubrivivax sp.]|nr:ABC transporter substrate-binding protein [Rubrivivax sp.]MDP3221739.1 ABC transporter substrate-binding protein [Rubrivivax sp.]MDP3612131.1 ABC transporter substrate-binding protein [Rubrivivax sp.]